MKSERRGQKLFLAAQTYCQLVAPREPWDITMYTYGLCHGILLYKTFHDPSSERMHQSGSDKDGYLEAIYSPLTHTNSC
jgi:hypothetical protein